MNPPDTRPSELSRVMQDIAAPEVLLTSPLSAQKLACGGCEKAENPMTISVAPTAQPTKRATVTERHREIIRIILQDHEACKGGFDDDAQLLADAEAEALADIRAIADRAHADLIAMSNKLASETARAFEAEKEARSFASKLICCENDLKVAERNLHLIADYVEPHWRGAGAKLEAAWILHELMDRARKHEDALEKVDAAEAEVAELRKDKARLDWLDAHEAGIEVHDEEIITCRVQASDDFMAHGFSDPYNAREAIDAALTRKTPTFQAENAGIEASMARKTGGAT